MITIAERIGKRLRRSSENLYELIEYQKLYHEKFQTSSVDLEQVVSGLEKLSNLAKGISVEIGIAVSGIRESDELTDDLARELAYSTSVSANIMDVFARSDPKFIQQFLELADPAPREVALRNLDDVKLAQWFQSVNKIREERQKND
jgi:hypothetical protein